MNISFQNLVEIKGGLSEKKIFRKYDKKLNKIFVDFSKNERDFNDFLNIYEILKKINISIPNIYEVHLNKKLIIMEDFGDDTFNKIFNKNDIYYFLKIAVDNLITIHNSLIFDDIRNLKKYSFNNLKEEISEFVDYFIPYKKTPNFSSDNFYRCWENVYNSYKFKFNRFMHKDFEFINLLFLNKNKNYHKCGIIDFQSAMIGFVGWDLFSILENPRIYFSREYNDDLIKYFYDNINLNMEYDTFINQYYFFNLARQTILLGRWVKLLNIQNNKDYLGYI